MNRDSIKDLNLPNSITYTYSAEEDEYSLNITNYPVQFLFQERLSCDLVEVLTRECYYGARWKSYIFQIIAALSIAQSRYNLHHNDLHLENVMVKPTRKRYLLYRLDRNPRKKNSKDIYFKVPTFGKIIKIIDWGRSTFEYGGKTIQNNCFHPDLDVFGQYYFEHDNFMFNGINRKKDIHRNPSMDMGLILYNVYHVAKKRVPTHSRCVFYQWLCDQCLNIKGINIYNACKEMNFTLYREISTFGKDKIPRQMLYEHIFDDYKWEKPDNFKDLIYSLK